MLSAKTKSLLIAVLLSTACQFVLSQAVTIDSGFNGNGKLLIDYNDSTNYLNYRRMIGTTLAVQADGKIIAGGFKIDSLLVCRYNVNGTPDSTFGSNGIAATFSKSDYVNSIRIGMLPDGKIILLAWDNELLKYKLYRYLPDGKPDNNFGQGGETILNFLSPDASIFEMELQRDGKILLAGFIKPGFYSWPGFYLVRLGPEGSIDSGFGNSGVASMFFSFVKSDTTDASVYSGGAKISDLVIQKDGKIIVCGTTSIDWNGYRKSDSLAILRYNNDGTLDNSFSGDGKLTFDIPNTNNPFSSGTFANAVCLQPDGKIVLGGGWYSFQTHGQWQTSSQFLMRLLSNGMMDSSFNNNGVKVFPRNDFNECTNTFVQSDGKIVLLGNSSPWGPFSGTNPQMMLERVENNGANDDSFGPDARWKPAFYNKGGNEIISGAYNGIMKGKRIYMIGEAQNFYDGDGWGLTIYALKIDGIAADPKTINVCASSSTATISSDLAGTTYQWQFSTDSVHFNNISNGAHYIGVNTPSLIINNIDTSWNLYQYRCFTGNSVSNVTIVHFLNTNENEWKGTVSNAWEDRANWLCGMVPGVNTSVIIDSGTIIIHSAVAIKNIQLNPGSSLTVDSGYSLSVSPDKRL